MTVQRIFIAAAAALVFASSAFAQGSNKPPSKPTASTTASVGTFKSLDKDGNGFIDRAEAGAMNGLAAQFAALDANKDGKLSNAEYAKYKPHR